MGFILTVDVGTSSLKAVLFDAGLRVVAQSRREYPTSYPRIGWAEQSPDDWCAALGQAVAEILGQAKITADAIAGIGIDGMSSLMLPVSASGDALSTGLIWLDRRAQAQSDLMAREHGDLLGAVTGNKSNPSNFGPKAMWLRDTHPDLYRESARLMHCNGYLVHRLTGVFTMDRSEAGLSQLCDIRTGAYSDELIDACGLDRRKLPDVVSCTDVVGGVTREAAATFGLAAGTPVIAGAMDNVAATVGLGLRKRGDSYVAAGTATNVGILIDEPVSDGLGLVYHVGIEGKWLVNGSVDYGSAGLLWFRNLLGDSDFEGLCREAAETTAADHPMLFLPYMTGQRAPLWNDELSGVMVGITPGTMRAHMVRMFMESTALGARHVFGKLRSDRPVAAALTGGITNNRLWTEIFADVTDMELTIPAQTEVSNLGMAILTGLGIGAFDSVDDAFALVPPGERREPDPANRAYYDDLYAVFEDTYQNNLGTLSKLNGLRKKYEVER